MRHRTILYSLALAALIALFSAPVLGDSQSQLDPTAQQQTVDAAIGHLFTQTAEAQGQAMLTQTIEAGFQQAQTATAAFPTTVQAGFDRALTATAEAERAHYGATLQAVRTPLSTESISRLGHVTALPDSRGVVSLAFSPDGRRLAAGGIFPDTGKLWDMTTGEPLNVFPDGGSAINRVALSETVLAAVQENTVIVLDYDGNIVFSQPGDFAPILSLAFSPDGTVLAVAGGAEERQPADFAIRLWDASTGEAIRQLVGHTAPVLSLAFSPDGTLLASASADDTIRLWDAADGTEAGVLEGHEQAVGDVAFSPDGMLLASVSFDNTVRLWDMESQTEQAVFEEVTPGVVLSVAFSPDGSLLASTGLDGVRLWNVATQESQGLISSQTVVNSLAFKPDGTLLAFASADLVGLWGVTGQPITPAPSGTATPTPSIAPTPLPPNYPTPTTAQLNVAEQVFEGGRMLWIQPTHQIWVLVVTATGRGAWTVYDDTFEEGEPEFDPAIVAPAERYQPMRGFGKLWRENPAVRQALGWATTPEFGYVSPYEYHPGGEVVEGSYIPGPGYHVLYSLYGEQFRFNESDGTWELGSE